MITVAVSRKNVAGALYNVNKYGKRPAEVSHRKLDRKRNEVGLFYNVAEPTQGLEYYTCHYIIANVMSRLFRQL